MEHEPIDKRALAADIGGRLRALQKDLEIETVDGFAEAFGWERGPVSNWLNGYNCPPVWHMIRLCRETGLTLDWVYMGDATGLPYAKSIRLEGLVKQMAVPPPSKVGQDDADADPVPASVLPVRKSRKKQTAT